MSLSDRCFPWGDPRLVYISDSVAAVMSRELSIVECFDGDAAKAYLKRSRIEFIIWVLSFAVVTAIAVSLFGVYGVDPSAYGTFFLASALALSVIDVAGLVGSIAAGLRYRRAKHTVIDSGEYIREVAAKRAADEYAELSRDLVERGVHEVLQAHGFYFGDIDTPYQFRCINENCYSSNYQISLVYVDGNYLVYARIDNFIRAVLRKERPFG